MKETRDFKQDLQRDFVIYVTFVFCLCANCCFYCCSRERESFMETYHQRGCMLWERVLRSFFHRGKLTVSGFLADVHINVRFYLQVFVFTRRLFLYWKSVMCHMRIYNEVFCA